MLSPGLPPAPWEDRQDTWRMHGSKHNNRRSLLPREALVGLVFLAACGAACVPRSGQTTTPPVQAFRLARVITPNGVEGQVALHGQLLSLGKDALPYRYHGEPALALERRERLLVVNGTAVGVDLTGASAEEALRWLSRVRRLELLVWRDVGEVEPRVVKALKSLGRPGLVLWLGEPLTASGPLDLRPLLPLCDVLHGLVLTGEITRETLEVIRRCGSLRALSLRGALPAGALEDLAALDQLESLDLSSALVAFGPGPQGLAPLRALRRLVALDLADNGLGDRDVEVLAGLRGLHWLRLAGNPITGHGLASLGGLPRLRWLDLCRTALTSAGLARLTGLRSLLWLGVEKSAVTGRGLEAFQRARPQVVLLSVGGALAVMGSEVPRSPTPTKGALSALGRVGEGSGLSTRHVAAPGQGIPECERYLALVRCFTDVARRITSGPPMAPRATEAEIRRQIRLTLPQGRAAVRRACQYEMTLFLKHPAFTGNARHCLRP